MSQPRSQARGAFYFLLGALSALLGVWLLGTLTAREPDAPASEAAQASAPEDSQPPEVEPPVREPARAQRPVALPRSLAPAAWTPPTEPGPVASSADAGLEPLAQAETSRPVLPAPGPVALSEAEPPAIAPMAVKGHWVIKLATLAPDGSTWSKALKDLGARWRELSGGKVELKVYPGGTQGDEGDMVRKMRVGQLSAGALSAVGLHDITPEPEVLAAPGLLQSGEELDAALAQVGPDLERALADHGFQVLTWAEAGPVRLFSQQPAPSLAELAEQPIFSWAGDPKAEEAWRAAGLTPKTISSVDMVPALQTGQIKAFATSPQAALSTGWFHYAQNMTDVSWGYLPAAVVVERGLWARMAAENPALPEALLAVARWEGAQLNAALRAQSAQAVADLRGQGLNVVEPTEAQRAAWQRAAERTWPIVREEAPATFDALRQVALGTPRLHRVAAR